MFISLVSSLHLLSTHLFMGDEDFMAVLENKENTDPHYFWLKSYSCWRFKVLYILITHSLVSESTERCEDVSSSPWSCVFSVQSVCVWLTWASQHGSGEQWAERLCARTAISHATFRPHHVLCCAAGWKTSLRVRLQAGQWRQSQQSCQGSVVKML